MLINFEDHLDKLELIRTGKLNEAPKIGIEEIDSVIRFKRNLTCFAGHANVGKTSVIIYFMLLFAMKHKIKFLVFSSENEPHSNY
jgi:GTP-binding protein EngB required for normal cell division